MIRLLFVAVLGALLASLTAALLSGDDGWTSMILPCAIALSVLLPVVLIAKTMSGIRLTRSPDPSALARAEAEGRLALARILRIRRTGTEINDQPVCDIDLVVAPSSGAAFEVRVRRIVDILEIPRLQPGNVVVVALDGPAPSNVALVLDPPPAWAERAREDDDVRRVSPSSVFEAPAARSSIRRIPAPFYAVALALGVILALIPAYPTIAALIAGETTLDDVRYESSYEGRSEREQSERLAEEAAANMFAGDNAQKALDVLAAEIGGTQVDSLTFWGTRLSATAPSAPGATTYDDISLDRGEVTNRTATSIQPDPADVAGKLFDLSALDPSIMPGLIAQAKELTGLEGDPLSEQWVYVSVRYVSGTDTRVPMFWIPIDDDYYDGDVYFTFDGAVVSMDGGAPGSAAFEASE
ncbi:hypothetical protein MN032_14960 [Agromyces atrinae]|uniref:hypothetical protein n=1 Tax=Agromyces atrinae TaxID=592376 RepID=UPI001F597C15|nr:hypothetical protein [Agromyces atrinae]MCI2958994.1 hypothetical protein [Agromyces atrinae]